jgi:hypothetical protein
MYQMGTASVADPESEFFPSGSRILDPHFFHPGSRIRIKYFNPKNRFLRSRKYEPGSGS